MSPSRHSAALVAEVLDVLPVTDTVFHDLAFTSPLTAILLDAISARPSSDRVLLVGPNVALAQALVDQGRDVTVWHVLGVALTEDQRGRVARTGTPDELFADLEGSGRFDIVVLPHVLDIAGAEPATLLAAARALVAANGVVLLAVRRAGALSARLSVLAGKSPLPDAAVAPARHSWSWPIGTPRRLVDLDGLREAARSGELRIVESKNVVETEGVVEVNALPFGKWLSARIAHAVKQVAPSLRDTMVVTLEPIGFGRPEASLGTDPEAFPTVTVVVESTDAERADRVVADLEAQTYPRDLVEVRVVPVGAAASNAAAAAARGELVAFTDDECRLPTGWVESGARGMGRFVMAFSGGILADETSAAPFLALPGQTRKTGGSGLFSIANSFYVRDALVSVGGFDERCGAAWGWDATAAARLRAAGYATAEDPTAFTFRHYPFPADRSWIRTEFEYALEIPAGIRRVPELRSSALHYRYFASERTLAFNAFLVGLGLAALRRNPMYAIAGAVPWFRSVDEFIDFWPPPEWRTSARHLRGAALRNFAWLAGLTAGSIRARKIVL